ncbi:hypothetical protein BpHYR1_001983, partial [Brachionus plicatilis]
LSLQISTLKTHEPYPLHLVVAKHSLPKLFQAHSLTVDPPSKNRISFSPLAFPPSHVQLISGKLKSPQTTTASYILFSIIFLASFNESLTHSVTKPLLLGGLYMHPTNKLAASNQQTNQKTKSQILNTL